VITLSINSCVSCVVRVFVGATHGETRCETWVGDFDFQDRLPGRLQGPTRGPGSAGIGHSGWLGGDTIVGIWGVRDSVGGHRDG